MDTLESAEITRAGNAPALSRDRQDRAAIARGLNDELEFHAWYDAEIRFETVLRSHDRLVREFTHRAFRQGLALGREGRA